MQLAPLSPKRVLPRDLNKRGRLRLAPISNVENLKQRCHVPCTNLTGVSKPPSDASGDANIDYSTSSLTKCNILPKKPLIPSSVAPIRLQPLDQNNVISSDGHRIQSDLRRQNVLLQQRVTRLENQLSLALGSASSSTQDYDHIVRESQRENRFIFGKAMLDLSLIERNVEVLNKITPSDPLVTGMACGSVVHCLCPQQPIYLQFYRNGLRIEDGNAITGLAFEFLSYSSHRTESFLTDLLQGFLPSELERQYPRGVKLHVVDHSTTAFTPSVTGPPSSPSFSPPPLRKSQLVKPINPPNRPKLATKTTPPFPKRHKSEPVIANPGLQTHPLKVIVREGRCLVKVRSRNSFMVFQLSPESSIQSLKTGVGLWMGSPSLSQFELRRGVGRECMNPSWTMTEAGLVPNGTLFYFGNSEPALCS